MRDRERQRDYNASYYLKHRQELLAQNRRYYLEHRAERQAYQLRRAYGVSQSDYDRALAEQGGVCKICGTAQPGGNHQHFQVDHDHTTHVFRGLLCMDCNRLLGAARDDRSILSSADLYLRGVV